MEVRFDSEAAVRRAVRGAVRDALLEAGLVRTAAPRGRSAPGDAPVDPETVAGLAAEAEPEPDGDPDDEPSPGRERGDERDPVTSPSTSGTGTGTPSETERSAATAPGDTDTDTDAGTPGTRSDDVQETERDGATAGAAGAPADGAASERKFRGAASNARLVDGADEEGALSFDRLPAMRVLGQLHDTYVVAETPGGLVLVDQHAADERVAYERLRERVEDGADRQELVVPVELELTAAEAAVFDDALPELEAAGFRADRREQTAVVGAVPAVLGDAVDPDLLRDALAEFLAAETDGESPVESAVDALLSDMACHPAITGNTSLSEGSTLALLEALDDCENPYACPHGRPVVVEIGEGELEERFERDYPGHQIRRPEE